MLLGRTYMTNLDSLLKSRDIAVPIKIHIFKTMLFPSNHELMWDLDHEQGWALKNWCFWTVVLEKTLESPLYSNEIKPVNAKGNQSWIFIGRTDVKAEGPILWPPDMQNWLIGKDPEDGKDWRQEEKRTTEEEMVGWHHQLNGHEFEQALGVGDGQGSLECCSPQSRKESDMTGLNGGTSYQWNHTYLPFCVWLVFFLAQCYQGLPML